MSESDLVRRIAQLERQVAELYAMLEPNPYKGEQAGDFTTTELPQSGDYGTQTTDDEVHVNIDGVIRAITTAAL